MKYKRITFWADLQLILILALFSALPLHAAPSFSRETCVQYLLSAKPIPDWKNLKEPFLGERPRGLIALRELIERNGIHYVLNGNRPSSPQELAELEFFWGTKLLFETQFNGQRRPVQGTGVVFHPIAGAKLINVYRGDVNPHLGWGNLHGVLGDKVAEYRMAEAVWPGLMPKTRTVAELIEQGKLGADFLENATRLKREVNRLLSQSHGKRWARTRAREVRIALTKLADRFFEAVKAEHPEGAFIKNYNETTTGDLNNAIRTPKSKASDVVAEFLAYAESLNSKGARPVANMSDPAFAWALDFEPHTYKTGLKFMKALLESPQDLLVQPQLDLAMTPQGFMREVRVDFVDGEPIFARNRYSQEFMPRDLDVAKSVVREFFARAPKELRYLSGGADVAFHVDGTPVVIEFNFGTASGTISPEAFPIESNMYLSALIGKRTPLIQRLEQVFQNGPAEQRKLLASTKVEREKWNKYSIEDISLAEYAKWLRNRHLEEWRKNPTASRTRRTMATLEKLFAGLGTPGNEDLPALLQGARDFFRSESMLK